MHIRPFRWGEGRHIFLANYRVFDPSIDINDGVLWRYRQIINPHVRTPQILLGQEHGDTQLSDKDSFGQP